MSGVMTPRSGVITPLLTSLPDITVGDVKEKEMSGVITLFQIVKEAVLLKKTSSGNVRITRNGDLPTTLLTPFQGVSGVSDKSSLKMLDVGLRMLKETKSRS